MKILKVKFENILIFGETFDFDLTAQDRVFENSGINKIWGPINSQQSIAIVGINASGKTTSLRLINLALEIVLNNRVLNDNLIPSMFVNENSMNKGVVMTVYFYKNDRVFKLESIIKYRKTKEDSIHFYFEEEELISKAKSSVTSRDNIFDFGKDINTSRVLRSELSYEESKYLRDDLSIVITENKDITTTVNAKLDDISSKMNCIQGDVSGDILNVFDSNIKSLERLDEGNDFEVRFKNNPVSIRSHILNIESIISSGTIKGQEIVYDAIIAIKNGGYLLIDELETHLNKELVKMIIDIFNDKNINKNGACLIFTTHYAEILDSFDRKDNIFVLVRDKEHFTKIFKYTDMIKRNELKKSDVLLSNYIKGTAPSALAMKGLKDYLCQNI